MQHEPKRGHREPRVPLSRRALLTGLLKTGTAGAIGLSIGEAPAAADDTAITPADIAAADKLAGRAYTEPERTLMARVAGDMRDALKSLRQYDLNTEAEPATHFNPCLPGTRVPTGHSGFSLSRRAAPAYSGAPDSLAFAPAVELAQLIKTGQVTSTALTRMYLDRLKKFGPRLNCVVTLTEELALLQADRADREIANGHYRGPLHGIPYGVKDLLATRGIRTTWGAKPYDAQVFDFNATVVQRLEDAGAVLLAKLSMGELALGDVWFGGRTRNPWRPEQGSSGSSAGPGSATAAGLVGFSIGTETLGSIVSPSVVNGVTGLRPTYGRVSRYGAMALCWTMDKIGPMCRSVEDCAMVLHTIYGPDGLDSTTADVPFRWDPALNLQRLRVGVDSAAFTAVERNDSRRKIYDDALDVLRRLGVKLHPVTLPPPSPAYNALASVIIDVESSAAFASLTASGRLSQLARQTPDAWPNTFRIGSTIPADDYLRALQVRRRLQQQMTDALKEVDLYVTIPFASSSLVYTNLTGHPTLVTRCGMLNGLPQSIEFTGALYREAAILRVALAYEQATNWHTQWPDTEKIPPLTDAGKTR